MLAASATALATWVLTARRGYLVVSLGFLLYLLDVGTVRQKATSYRTLASNLDACESSLKEALTALEGAWEGNAALQVTGRVGGQVQLLEERSKDLKFVAGCLEGLARCVEEIHASWLREPNTGAVYQP